eukprot:1974213-Amphidinium_carterae.3
MEAQKSKWQEFAARRRKCGDGSVVVHMQDRSAYVNQASKESGWTALMAAARAGHVEAHAITTSCTLRAIPTWLSAAVVLASCAVSCNDASGIRCDFRFHVGGAQAQVPSRTMFALMQCHTQG